MVLTYYVKTKYNIFHLIAIDNGNVLLNLNVFVGQEINVLNWHFHIYRDDNCSLTIHGRNQRVNNTTRCNFNDYTEIYNDNFNQAQKNKLKVQELLKISNWMSYINDNILLSQLSIPGTHDSCAHFGGSLYECQHLRLNEQLVLGIRFVDIRCRHFRNNFTIHHEGKYQNMNFTDVLQICKDFLLINPGECIIMRIKKEYKDGEVENTRDFKETFNEYYNNFSDIFYKQTFSMFFSKPEIPILKDVRGKIWVISQFNDDKGFFDWCDCQI
jgi:hypothetical protein